MKRKRNHSLRSSVFIFLAALFLLFTCSVSTIYASTLQKPDIAASGKFVKDGDYWIYRYDDKTIAKNVFLKINKKTYYFNKLGHRWCSWHTIKGKNYYFGTRSQGYLIKNSLIKCQTGKGGACKMNPLILAQEIIDGRRITRKDDLSFFLTCDLDELCEGADRIREAYIGDKVDLCSIINGRSGRCPEDCKYCAQSVHHHTSCEIYDFLPEEKILEACKMNEEEGVDRFSIVTAGKALTGKEFDQAIHAYETMYKECNIDLCASMGFLSSEQLHRLHEAGVTSYHHNIETSRRNFPNICTTHTYDMKIETLKKVKAEGMCACSGGIIGMGETWEDRLDMAVSLAELGIDSIPINALMPIPGTPLEHLDQLSEQDILRTIAFFRYINPEANIRLAAGRALLTNDGETAFKSGASATITGNMLTTVACATIRSDRKMLSDMGRNVTPEYWKEVEES